MARQSLDGHLPGRRASSTKRKERPDLIAMFAGSIVVVTLGLLGVSVVLDPAHIATGTSASVREVSGFGLSTGCGSYSASEIDVRDYSYNEIAAMYSDDDQARSAALRDKLKSEIQVNEYGQTYGAMGAGDPATGEGIPDLIAVMATNGKHGYVYSAELLENGKKADLMAPSRREQLYGSQTESRSAMRDEAFYAGVKELLGFEMITREEAAEIMALTPQNNGLDISWDRLNEILAERVAANVDANGKNLIPGATVADIIDLFKERSEMPNYVTASEPVTFVDYMALHDAANNAGGINYPVYESDGRTQIGVFSVWDYT